MLDDFGRRKVDINWKARGLHKWGQSEKMAHEPILGLTDETHTILDPFLGSGTTTRIAMQNERNSVGYETDETLLPLIKKKINLEPTACKLSIIKREN